MLLHTTWRTPHVHMLGQGDHTRCRMLAHGWQDNLASHTMEPMRSMLGCPSGMLLCKRGGLIRECHRLRDATDAALAMRGSIPPVDGGQISQSWADASDCTGVLLHIPHS